MTEQAKQVLVEFLRTDPFASLDKRIQRDANVTVPKNMGLLLRRLHARIRFYDYKNLVQTQSSSSSSISSSSPVSSTSSSSSS